MWRQSASCVSSSLYSWVWRVICALLASYASHLRRAHKWNEAYVAHILFLSFEFCMHWLFMLHGRLRDVSLPLVNVLVVYNCEQKSLWFPNHDEKVMPSYDKEREEIRCTSCFSLSNHSFWRPWASLPPRCSQEASVLPCRCYNWL